MGLLDLFKPQSKTPMVQSILPDAAVQEILRGRLPILNTNKIFLKSGEVCHYIDKAIYEKKTVRKRYVRRNSGYSAPGLFKGTRVNYGGGTTDQVRQCYLPDNARGFYTSRTAESSFRVIKKDLI